MNVFAWLLDDIHFIFCALLVDVFAYDRFNVGRLSLIQINKPIPIPLARLLNSFAQHAFLRGVTLRFQKIVRLDRN
jgi:hypothetical protein